MSYAEKLQSIRWSGLHRLQQEREAGVTQAGLERETIASAKESGRDISRASGGRRPTEVFDDELGEWVRVVNW